MRCNGDFAIVALVTPAERPPTNLFLVERYLPATNYEVLSATVRRVADTCATRRDAGVDLHYIHSIYIPAEDTCFCVFRAASAAAVHAANDAHTFRIDRISAGFELDTLTGHRSPSAAGSAVPPRRGCNESRTP